MKIAYFVRVDVSQESGVLKKISRQIKAWQLLGHKVKLFAFTHNLEKNACVESIDSFCVKSPRILSNYLVSKDLIDEIIAWEPNLVYFRFDVYYPHFIYLMKRIPVIVEINTYELSQYKIDMNFVFYIWHVMTRKQVFRNARGLVFLTNETAKRYAEFAKANIVIGDSIELSMYPLTKAPQNKFPKLVFMGGNGAAPWYGLDKIIYLAKEHRDWEFDLIGISKDNFSEAIPQNIKAYGVLNRSQYEQILVNADIALSTLALHRISMNASTPMKVREYLAYGLPTITAYQDTDFPDPVPYILQLPNYETNVIDNLSVIAEFVDSWKGKRVPQNLLKHLDVSIKEERRLNFMSRCL